MNCNQCLDSGPLLCCPVHAARALSAGVARLWRGVLASLAELG